MRMAFVSLLAGCVMTMGGVARAQKPPQAPAASAAQSAPPGNAENGKKLYLANGCWTCHDYDAHGGGGSGPRLAGRALTWAGVQKAVRQPSEDMVPFTTKVLSDQQLADIFAWIKSIPPSPPAGSIPQIAK